MPSCPRPVRRQARAQCFLTLAVVLAACPGPGDDDPLPLPPVNRPATPAELVGLVRASLVEIGATAMRASKAFEGTKAWSDAEAGRIDCDIDAGTCVAEVEELVDSLIAEFFPAESIARTTETETVYARSIEIGMSPYRIEWRLTSPSATRVVIDIRLGDEATPAGLVSLTPTAASVETSLSAFQTLIEMSRAMDELEDSNLVERLMGTMRWSLLLTGPSALTASVEVRDLGFTVSFMDDASLVYTSEGAIRVAATHNGERREAQTSLTLPRSTLSLPAHLLQDDYLTRCEFPSDPCLSRARETFAFELFPATFEASGVANTGVFQLDVTGPSGPWMTLAADGTEFARIDMSSFAMRIQTAAREFLLDVPSRMTAGFGFDLRSLSHIFEAAPGFERERFSAAFEGRASISTAKQSGPADILRMLEGELSASAAVIEEEIRVGAGQCLLDVRPSRPGISEDHPFAHIGAGACRR